MFTLRSMVFALTFIITNYGKFNLHHKSLIWVPIQDWEKLTYCMDTLKILLHIMEKDDEAEKTVYVVGRKTHLELSVPRFLILCTLSRCVSLVLSLYTAGRSLFNDD